MMNTIMQLRKICNHPFMFQHIEASVNFIISSFDCVFMGHLVKMIFAFLFIGGASSLRAEFTEVCVARYNVLF